MLLVDFVWLFVLFGLSSLFLLVCTVVLGSWYFHFVLGCCGCLWLVVALSSDFAVLIDLICVQRLITVVDIVILLVYLVLFDLFLICVPDDCLWV